MIPEILYKLENLVIGFSPTVQITAGLVLAIFGLCFWLAATALGRIATAVLGAIIGFSAAYISTGHFAFTTIFWTLAGCVGLLFISEIFIKLLGHGSVPQRFVSSIFYSFIGTAMTFSGMIILLRCKGSEPAESIIAKQEFYGIVFLAMFVFGTLEQLLLTKKPKAKQAVEEKVTENKTGKVKSWRTA